MSKKEENLGLVTFKKSDCHGKGLIANQNIPKGTYIHVTHVWTKKYDTWANVMPNCMYNHSKIKENSEVKTIGDNTKILTTLKDIEKGDELFVDFTKSKDLEQPQEGWSL